MNLEDELRRRDISTSTVEGKTVGLVSQGVFYESPFKLVNPWKQQGFLKTDNVEQALEQFQNYNHWLKAYTPWAAGGLILAVGSTLLGSYFGIESSEDMMSVDVGSLYKGFMVGLMFCMGVGLTGLYLQKKYNVSQSELDMFNEGLQNKKNMNRLLNLYGKYKS